MRGIRKVNVLVEFKDRTGATTDARMYIHTPKGMGNATPLPPRVRDAVKKTTQDKDLRLVRLVDVANNCSGNAIMNKASFEHIAQKSLRLVCGSFGVVKDGGSVWWEWGTGSTTSDHAQDFLVAKNDPSKQDCHFWLEDEDDNVFDIVPQYISNVVIPFHKAKVHLTKLACEAVISGVNKVTLRRWGLVYLPASASIQEEIIAHRKSRMRVVLL